LKISIIIPAFNEERLIDGTLRQTHKAAEQFTQRGWHWETIVCDNNSTDRTAEIARAAGATVVFEPVNQIGRARNSGAAAAAGDWLIFVDADSQPSAELFEEVANEIQSGHCLAGGTTVKLEGHYPTANFAVGLWNAVSRAGRLMAGSFIFCERSAFGKVGGFSKDLFVAEEIDLSLKLKRLAWESGKEVVILHRHPLLTSARKVHLYTMREHIAFLARTLLARGRTFNHRESCHPWYDGRR
jgi:glycosyltransferase involved in cell wall biosynthesis